MSSPTMSRCTPGWYTDRMTRQIAIRIPDELAEELETLVAEGEYPTTAAAVREAVRELAERRRRQKLDDAIVEGYRRHPPTPEEEAWADSGSADFLTEEPW
jgi:Arc/MetJ-type ribon-helix-helix transcriptional regulator